MALSNWDTLAIDQDGNANGGRLILPSGLEIDIYKNWVRLRDPAKCSDDDGYPTSPIAELQHGQFILFDGSFFVERGPQDGVYVAVVASRWDPTKRAHVEPQAMLGCGVYGYEEGAWTGVTQASKDFLFGEFWSRACETLSILRDLHEKMLPAKDKATRFNQGDAYFAQHLEAEVPTTLPGQADPTILSQLFTKP